MYFIIQLFDMSGWFFISSKKKRPKFCFHALKTMRKILFYGQLVSMNLLPEKLLCAIEYFDFHKNVFIQGFLFIRPKFVLLYNQ